MFIPVFFISHTARALAAAAGAGEDGGGGFGYADAAGVLGGAQAARAADADETGSRARARSITGKKGRPISPICGGRSHSVFSHIPAFKKRKVSSSLQHGRGRISALHILIFHIRD